MPITPIAAENKMDGIRMCAHREGKRVWIFTEDKKRDRAPYLPDVVADMRRLPVRSVILDSETTIWEGGAPIPRHEMIRLVVSKKPLRGEDVRVNVFDILYYNGKSLIDLSWKERQVYLKKVLPRDLKHLKRVIPCIITDRRTFDKCIEKTSKALGSEGSMLKSVEGKYNLKGRTGEWAKYKKVFELKVSVIGTLKKVFPFPKGQTPKSDLTGDEALRTFRGLQEKSKTYILRCAFRDKAGKLTPVFSDHRLTPGDLSLKWDSARKEWKGTEDPRIWRMGKGFAQRKHGEYAYGNTYAKRLDPAPKMGSIVTVRPIMMRKFKMNGATGISWMFPNLREIDPTRSAPDTIEDVERIVRESAARTPGKKAQMEIMKAIHYEG
ncbi:DNA ligase [subsurface metagenome]